MANSRADEEEQENGGDGHIDAYSGYPSDGGSCGRIGRPWGHLLFRSVCVGDEWGAKHTPCCIDMAIECVSGMRGI